MYASTLDTQDLDGLISDLDGTLVHSEPLIRESHYATAEAALLGLGLSRGQLPTFEEYTKAESLYFGGGIPLELTGGITTFAPWGIDKLNIEQLIADLMAFQAQLAPTRILPFPGLEDLLTKIGASGMGFGILSSGTDEMVGQTFGSSVFPPDFGLGKIHHDPYLTPREKLARQQEIIAWQFSMKRCCVITYDDVTYTKPHPEGAKLVLERIGCNATRAAFAGNDLSDMEVAVNTDLGGPVIGVVHEGIDPLRDSVELITAGATSIAHNLRQLAMQLGL